MMAPINADHSAAAISPPASDPDHVYVLMTDRYRISRNIRAQWYLQTLNSSERLEVKNNINDCTNEIDIISIYSHSQNRQKSIFATESSPPEKSSCSDEAEKRYVEIATNSIFNFFSRKYSFVYILDMSTSICNVDIQHSSVLTDELFSALSKCLQSLVHPFYVPGSQFLFTPEIFVSILVYSPFYSSDRNNVIVHGFKLCVTNIDQLLAYIKRRCYEFIDLLHRDMVFEQDFRHFSLNTTADSSSGGRSPPQNVVPAEESLVNMIRFGLLTLNLLPDNSHESIVIVTDGNLSFPNAIIFGSALAQLRLSMISCSFVQIGSPPHPDSSFGHVPYNNFMKFFSTATFGAYLSISPDYVCDYAENTFNDFHQVFLVWTFHCDRSVFCKELRSPEYRTKVWSIDNPYFYSTSDEYLPDQKDQHKIRKRQFENRINASLAQVLSYRLREGFTIKRVNFRPGDNNVEICLLLPWRHNVNIEYNIDAPYHDDFISSDEDDQRLLTYEIVIESCYSFLHDITCSTKKTFKSRYRATTIEQFWATLKNFSDSDKLGIHFHHFAKNEVYRSMPESLKNGLPLFYLPPDANAPEVSCNNDAHLKFSQYWRPICLLDVNVCQKSSLHTLQVNILLKHDTPLPEYLYRRNAIGRYDNIQCNQAMSMLNDTLKKWSSFVLLENHSYIKLINEKNSSSCSFYLVRIISQPPCIVLHLAFIGGTSSSLRNQIVNELSVQLKQCKLPQRNVSSSLAAAAANANASAQSGASSAVKIVIKQETPPTEHEMHGDDEEEDDEEEKESECSVASAEEEEEEEDQMKEEDEDDDTNDEELTLSSGRRNHSKSFREQSPRSERKNAKSKNENITISSTSSTASTNTTTMTTSATSITTTTSTATAIIDKRSRNISGQVNCFVLLKRPIERMLIRYEKIPTDFDTCFRYEDDLRAASDEPHPSLNMFRTLTRFLVHKRFMWSTHNAPYTRHLSISSVSKILSVLTMKRIQEGFHLAYNDCGIVNLVMELTMRDRVGVEFPCLVQYIIFPSTDIADSNLDEADTKLSFTGDFDYPSTDSFKQHQQQLQQQHHQHKPQHHHQQQQLIVTECWVEPQNGQVIDVTNGDSRFLQDLEYEQISQSFYDSDLEVIRALLTYEHLRSFTKKHRCCDADEEEERQILPHHNDNRNPHSSIVSYRSNNQRQFPPHQFQQQQQQQQPKPQPQSDFSDGETTTTTTEADMDSIIATSGGATNNNNNNLKTIFSQPKPSPPLCSSSESLPRFNFTRYNFDLLNLLSMSQQALIKFAMLRQSFDDEEIENDDAGCDDDGNDVFDDNNAVDEIYDDDDDDREELKEEKEDTLKSIPCETFSGGNLGGDQPQQRQKSHFSNSDHHHHDSHHYQSHAHDHINMIFHSELLLKLLELHDRELIFTETDSLRFIELVNRRLSAATADSQNTPLGGEFFANAAPLILDRTVQFKCFCKHFSANCLLVTIVPASYRAIRALSFIDDDDHDDTGTKRNGNLISELYCCSSNDLSRTGSLIAPIITYKLTFRSLSGQLLRRRARRCTDAPILARNCGSNRDEDNDEPEDGWNRLFDFSSIERYDHHFDPRPAPLDTITASDEIPIEHFVKQIEIIFWNSFADATYKALQYGLHVDQRDIDLVLEKCSLKLYTHIDITKYLIYTCEHLKTIADRYLRDHAGEDIIDFIDYILPEQRQLQQQQSQSQSQSQPEQQLQQLLRPNKSKSRSSSCSSNGSSSTNHTAGCRHDKHRCKTSTSLVDMFKPNSGTAGDTGSRCCRRVNSGLLRDRFVAQIQTHFSPVPGKGGNYYYYDYENIQKRKFTFGAADMDKPRRDLIRFYRSIQNGGIDLADAIGIKRRADRSTFDAFDETIKDEVDHPNHDRNHRNSISADFVDYGREDCGDADDGVCSLILPKPFFAGFSNSFTLRSGTELLQIIPIPTCYYQLLSALRHESSANRAQDIKIEDVRVYFNIEIIMQNLEHPLQNAESKLQILTAALHDFQVYKYQEFVRNINWLVSDEIVSLAHHSFDTSAGLLRAVIRHIECAGNSNTSLCDKLELQFIVDDNQECLRNFCELLPDLKFSNFQLRALGEYFFAFDPTERPLIFTATDEDEDALSRDDSFVLNEDLFRPSNGEENVEIESLWTTMTGGGDDQSIWSPNFWLILTLDHASKPNNALLYFHSRQNVYMYGLEIFNQLKLAIEQLCKRINQKLLLDQMNETKECENLLISADEKDSYGKHDMHRMLSSTPTSATIAGAQTRITNPVLTSEPELEISEDNKNFKLVKRNFLPGTFACDLVWEKHFPLHPRLHGKGGLNAIRQGLNAFAVNNRHNVYVYREISGSVFYMRLYETFDCGRHSFGEKSKSNICAGRSPSNVIDVDDDDDDEDENDDHDEDDHDKDNHHMTSDYRKNLHQKHHHHNRHRRGRRGGGQSGSGHLQLQNYYYDNIISSAELNYSADSIKADSDKDTDSIVSFNIAKPAERSTQQCITLKVYGLTEPGTDIRKDMVIRLQKRLDEVVLETLILMLIRNPLSKLTYEDVCFIQGSYFENFYFTINENYAPYMLNIKHYIRQNLSIFMYNPKYADANAEYHFKLFKNGEYHCVMDEDVFVLHCQQESGKDSKGVGCVIMSILSKDKQAIGATDRFAVNAADMNDLLSGNFENMTSCYAHENERGNVSFYVNFQLWYSGKIDVDTLHQRLMDCIRNSLWDFNLEFKIFKLHTFDDAMNRAPSASVSEPSTPKKKLSEKRERRSGLSVITGMQKNLSNLEDKTSSAHQLWFAKRSATISNNPTTTTTGVVDLTAPQTAAIGGCAGSADYFDFDIGSNEFSSGRNEFFNLAQTINKMIKPWLDFGKEISVPSLKKCTFAVVLKSSIPTVIDEFQKSVKPFCGDMNHHVAISSSSTANTSATPSTAIPSNYYGDFEYIDHSNNNRFDQSDKLMILLRHDALWNSRSLNSDFDDSFSPQTNSAAVDCNSFGKLFQRYKNEKGRVTFMPIFVATRKNNTSISATINDANASRNEMLHVVSSENLSKSGTTPTTTIATSNIAAGDPNQHFHRCVAARQKFLLLYIEDCYITLYLYNWSSGLSTPIVGHFANLILWHNSRSLLLQSLILQKAGIFHHLPFKRHSFDELLALSNVQTKDLNVGAANLFAPPGFGKDGKISSMTIFRNTDLLLRYSNYADAIADLAAQQAQASKESNAASNTGSGGSGSGSGANIPPSATAAGSGKSDAPSKGDFVFESKIYSYIFSNFDSQTALNLFDYFSCQFNSNYNVYIRDLKDLSKVWQLHGAKLNSPTMEKITAHVKRYGRLSHFCLTPFLFSPKWRYVIATIRDHAMPATNSTGLRSRHMSGGHILRTSTTGNGANTSTTEQEFLNAGNSVKRSRRRSGPPNMLENSLTGRGYHHSSHHLHHPQHLLHNTHHQPHQPHHHYQQQSQHHYHQNPNNHLIISPDDCLDIGVCPLYIQEYVQYLQSLGFSSIKSSHKTSSAGGGRPRSFVELDRRVDRLKAGISFAVRHKSTNQAGGNNEYDIKFYSIKTLLGGFFLFEIGFCEPYVYSYLYSFDSARFAAWTKIDSFISHMNGINFLDELDSIKVRMHLHSFTYDYHLRVMHSYISGRQLLFNQGYHLISFLDDFIKYYQKAPNYSRNHVYSDMIRFESKRISPDQLFNYIINNNKLYHLDVFSMKAASVIERDKQEFVLIQLSSHRIPYVDEHNIRQEDNFDVGVLISYQRRADQNFFVKDNLLCLKFFVLLTSQRELFPKLTSFNSDTKGAFRTIRLLPSATANNIATSGSSNDEIGAMKSAVSSTTTTTPLRPINDIPFHQHLRHQMGPLVPYSGICDENINYLGYFNAHEIVMRNILSEKVRETKQHLDALIRSAEIDCRRDSLWNCLIPAASSGGEGGQMNSATADTRMALDELNELLTLVKAIRLDQYDGKLAQFYAFNHHWYRGLAAKLELKFEFTHRKFIDKDNFKMAFFKMNCKECFILFDLKTSIPFVDFNIVFKKPLEIEMNDDFLYLCNPQYHELVEEFINACTSHMWSVML